MPRVSDDGSAGGDGIRVRGVYLAMLDREREHHNRYGRDGITWVDDNDPSQGCVVRPRELLDLLEAGRPVIVRRIKAGHKRSTPPVVLPWDPRTVRFVQVGPGDTITPAAELEWDGAVGERRECRTAIGRGDGVHGRMVSAAVHNPHGQAGRQGRPRPPRLSRKSRERLTEKLDAYKHCSGCQRTFVPQRHGALTAVTSVRTMAYRPTLQF